MIEKWLFKRVDNSALIVFRVIFGLLITIEAWGAIATGWIKHTLLEGAFTFNFIGLDFLQPLPGNGMYYYYGLMGLFGVFVMIGFKYRYSVFFYGIMWSCVYLMQKSSYNNHYYLLMLLLGIMTCLPANRYLSVDVWRKPELKKISMPNWVYIVIIAQMWIVYTYGSIAKLYPDWLDATVPRLLMLGKKDYWLIGPILQESWTHYTIAYVGILYDGLIIPALLWRRTRWFAFGFSIFFHLFNSIVFQIGIFPYMSLAFSLFFFDSKMVHRIFLRKKEYYTGDEVVVPKIYKPALAVFVVYFVFQVGLPLRHWFIQDNVLWTEEGHRLSWRMMLRTKHGQISFRVKNKKTQNILLYELDMLSRKQNRAITSKPDMIWQMAQRIKTEEAAKGNDVEVYVNARVRVNGRPYETLIDPEVDLAAAQWDYWGHNDWILPSNLSVAPTYGLDSDSSAD